MSFLNKNQAYLQKTTTLFAAANEKAFTTEDDAEYIKKDEYYLAQRQGVSCFVNSIYNAAAEIEIMFNSVPRNAESIMLFGCGLGGAVRYALSKGNFPSLQRLVIVEPSPAWAQLVMSETDMAEIWGEGADKISFFVGYRPDIIGGGIAAANMNTAGEIFPVYHLSVRTLFSEYYQELLAGITDYLRNMLVLINTSKSMPHRKSYNEVLNLARPAYELTQMTDLFIGRNIIIVSAGPSLGKNIHLLPEAKKKAVVVAVGSATPILDAQGIKPHFRVAVDPYPAQHKIFGNLKDDSVPLIHTSALYAEILSGYKGPRFRLQTDNEFLSFFLHNKRKLPAMVFPAGPSVVNGTAEFFCAAGCKHMVFIGQDMCMYDRRLHAATTEDHHKNVSEKDMLFLKDINGNDVVSPRNYYMIKQYLENTITRFSGKVEFINATEGGLGLYGAPNQPLAAVLAGWEEDDAAPLIAERLEKMELIDFQAELGDMEEIIGKIDLLIDENLKNLQKIKDIFMKDEHFTQREKYVRAFKAAQKNEQELKKIDWHTINFIQHVLETFLKAECYSWQKNIDNADEKIKFRSILEIQLKTAQTTKSLTITLKKALKEVFAAKVKTKTFSLLIK